MTTNENTESAIILATGQIVAAMQARGGDGGPIENLIVKIRKALAGPLEDPKPEVVAQAPAVEIRRSIRPEAIYCLECGTPHTSIKRHLSAQHGLSPDAYRAKWNLRPDYPMVTVAYSAKRSELAKANGLGRKGSH